MAETLSPSLWRAIVTSRPSVGMERTTSYSGLSSPFLRTSSSVLFSAVNSLALRPARESSRASTRPFSASAATGDSRNQSPSFFEASQDGPPLRTLMAVTADFANAKTSLRRKSKSPLSRIGLRWPPMRTTRFSSSRLANRVLSMGFSMPMSSRIGASLPLSQRASSRPGIPYCPGSAGSASTTLSIFRPGKLPARLSASAGSAAASSGSVIAQSPLSSLANIRAPFSFLSDILTTSAAATSTSLLPFSLPAAFFLPRASKKRTTARRARNAPSRASVLPNFTAPSSAARPRPPGRARPAEGG